MVVSGDLMDPFLFPDLVTNLLLWPERGKVTAPRHWHSCSGGGAACSQERLEELWELGPFPEVERKALDWEGRQSRCRGSCKRSPRRQEARNYPLGYKQPV